MLYRHLMFLWNGGLLPEQADPRELRQRRTLSTTALIACVVGAAVIVLNITTGAVSEDSLIILAGISFVLLALYLQSYGNRQRFAANLIIFSYWATITIVMSNYALRNHTWVWLVYVPVLAMLLLDYSRAFYWTLLPALSLWGYSLVDQAYPAAIEGTLVLLIVSLTTYVFRKNQAAFEANLLDTQHQLRFEKEEKAGAERLVNDMQASVNLSTQVMDRMAEGIILVTQAGGLIVYANRRFEEIFGYDRDELNGKPVSILNAPDSLAPGEAAQQYIREVSKKGTWSGEIANIKRDGSKFWTHANITTFEHSEYGPVLLAIQQDISRAKQADKELQFSKNLLEKAQHIALIGHWTLNPDTGETAASDELYRIYEMPRGEKTLSSFLNCVHPEDKELSIAAVRGGVENLQNWEIEHRIITMKGEEKWIHAIGEISFDEFEKTKVIVGTVQDITAQKVLEKSLRVSEERLNEAERLAKIGRWELELKSNRLHWSDEVFSIFELEPQQFKATYEAFLDNIHPDDRERVNLAYSDSLKHKTPYKIEHRLLLKNGAEKTVVEFCESHFDDAGNPLRSIGMIQDISEQKQAQQEKLHLEKQLRDAQKMEAIGTLAGGIAHDLNNILTPIMGYTSLAISQLSMSDPIADNLTNIEKGAIRARELIEQILLFSRQAETKQSPMKLQSVVSEAMRLLQVSIPPSISIELKLDTNSDEILADASQIHQLIMNLCTNAWHAMEPEGGTLTVELEQLSGTEELVSQHPNLSADEYLCLSVKDTGPGIDSKHIDNIFEPFFTTKSVGEGTGLGLAVVHGIVTDHNGLITVQSESGKGATFRVFLPLYKGMKKAADTGRKPSVLQRGIESIMIVDDDISVSGVMEAMLKNLGYRVTTFTDSVNALEELSRAAEKYDVLISDLKMPKLTGLELIKRLQRSNTRISTIIMSGDSSTITAQSAQDLGISKVLSKPITMSELAEVVREVLDQ